MLKPPKSGVFNLYLSKFSQVICLLVSKFSQVTPCFVAYRHSLLACLTQVIAPLRQYCTDQNQHIANNHNEVKAYNAWNVAQSNPSFEIWLYYHIYDSKPTDEEVEKVHSFKEYVNSKISGGFNFQIHPVFLEDAIEHSKEQFSKDDEGLLERYATEMHLLGHEILGFTKQELDKLKNKIG